MGGGGGGVHLQRGANGSTGSTGGGRGACVAPLKLWGLPTTLVV